MSGISPAPIRDTIADINGIANKSWTLFFQKLWEFANIYKSSEQTITSAGLLTLPHGKKSLPFIVQLSLVCQSTEAGYAAGDVIYIVDSSASNYGVGVYADTTNIYVRFGSNANVFSVNHKTTGVTTNLTNSKWKLVVKGIFSI